MEGTIDERLKTTTKLLHELATDIARKKQGMGASELELAGCLFAASLGVICEALVEDRENRRASVCRYDRG